MLGLPRIEIPRAGIDYRRDHQLPARGISVGRRAGGRYALIGVADGAVRLYLPRRAAGGIRSLGGSRRPGGDGETLADLHDVQAAGRERRDDGVR